MCTMDVDSSSFASVCAGAKAALVHVGLIDPAHELLDRFALGGCYYTTDSDDASGQLVNAKRVPIAPLDVLTCGGKPLATRKFRLVPHHFCAACHVPIKPSFREYTATQRQRGAPYITVCRNCPTVRALCAAGGLVAWGRVAYRLDTTNNVLVPLTGAVNHCPTPRAFHTVWQAHARTVALLQLVLARARRAGVPCGLTRLSDATVAHILRMIPVAYHASGSSATPP